MIWFTLLTSAFALQPPQGWVSVDSRHALLSKSAPEKGELYEIPADKENPQSLGFSMMSKGYDLKSVSRDPYGRAVMKFSNREAIAVWSAENKSWTVLMYSPENSSRFSSPQFVTALFKEANAKSDTPQTIPWSGDAESENWSPEAVESSWERDSVLLGSWRGSGLIRGLSSHIRIVFENNGSMQVEVAVEGKKQNFPGYWTTSEGKLRLHYNKKTSVGNYHQLGSTLQFEFEKAQITFYRQ